MRPLVKFLRACGIRCVIYIDDLICFHGESQKVAEEESSLVFRIILWLGLTLNVQKSVMVPTQEVTYLGLIINSIKMTFTVTPSRIEKLRGLAKLLYKAPNTTPRKVASIVAMVSSMAYAVLPWRLCTRALAFDLTELKRSVAGNWDGKVVLSKEAFEELTWWINALQENFSRPIRDLPVKWTTASDASKKGYGGTGPEGIVISKPWPEGIESTHSTYLEPLGAALVIREVVEKLDLRDGVLEHASDNMVVKSYTNKQGGKIQKTSRMFQQLWVLCLERNIELRGKYTPGESLQGKEDLLSRAVSKESEWSVPKEVFNWVAQVFGTPTVDGFSNRYNNQVEEFWTLVEDPLAVGMDFFTADWSQGFPWLYPPFILIGRVLRMILQSQGKAVVVTPLWKGASWWPTIRWMCQEEPLWLGNRVINLEGTSQWLKWPLIGWRLSGVPSELGVFQTKSTKLSLKSVPTRMLMGSGEDSLAGAQVCPKTL